ncbi:MAG: hypothetical protein FWD61_08410 [Phycisphaerales bacterium]|nr:hypothetical protein [Phycisphaerales bacterium]
MIKRILIASLLLGVPCLAQVPSPPSPASSPAPRAAAAEIELQRKLDVPFTLLLQKVELAEAFKQIAGAGQIALQVDPGCYEALPYGATTRVTVDFRESKLREAIEQVLVPLCLEQVVSGSTVIIRPTAPLARIGRRADWDELKLLQELRTGSLKASSGSKPPAEPGANGSVPFDWTAALRAALDGHPHLVVSIPPTTASEAGALHEQAIEQLKKQLPLSPFRALELYCQLTNQIWFVEAGPASGVGKGGGDGTVMIMPVRRWIDRQLQRPIKIAFTNAPLQQVVDEMSHLSGIRFTPAPGLYQAMPRVSVNSDYSSVEATLKAISGGTGIAFDIGEDSIYLHMATAGVSAQGAVPSPVRTDRVVARIAVPIAPSSSPNNAANGLTMDILIYESDLPTDLNELRKKKLQESVEALQKALIPQPHPSSQTQTE